MLLYIFITKPNNIEIVCAKIYMSNHPKISIPAPLEIVWLSYFWWLQSSNFKVVGVYFYMGDTI